MGLEPRGRADQGQPVANPQGEEPGAGPGPKAKPFEIGKRLVYQAWEKVRANNGAPGVDAVSTGLFEEQLRGNLYKLWNRMSSGCYFPGAVRGVEIRTSPDWLPPGVLSTPPALAHPCPGAPYDYITRPRTDPSGGCC